MTETLIVENCTEADLPDVQRLCDVLYSEDPCIHDLRVDVGLARAQFDAHPEKGRLLVMKDSGQVVGYCIIIFFWSNEYSGDLIEIDEVNVAESYRGRGVGGRFFAWLRSNFPHCKGFTLQVADKNVRARDWYYKLGFSIPRNQHMIWIFPES